MPEQSVNKSQWDLRADGTPKGDGFLGILQRPDGRVSTEISIGTKDVIPGQETEIPTIVPTLTPAELHFLLVKPDKMKIPAPIADKAVDYARSRIAQGLPVFAQPGEQQYHIYPQFARVGTPSSVFNDATIRPVPSH